MVVTLVLLIHKIVLLSYLLLATDPTTGGPSPTLQTSIWSDVVVGPKTTLLG